MFQLLATFACLQLLDVLTTLAFSATGLAEGNPIVRMLAAYAGSTLGGLLAAKTVAAVIAIYCWRSQRRRLLIRANFLYAAVVSWNVLAILFQTVTGQGG